MPENQRDQIAESLLDTQKQVGDAVSQGLQRDPSMTRLSAERERRLFWQRAIPPEQEAQLWAQGVDPWEISSRVFPKRWQLMGMGRTTDTEKVDWLKQHVRQGPPTPDAGEDDAPPSAPLPSALGRPAPGDAATYPADDDPALGYG